MKLNSNELKKLILKEASDFNAAVTTDEVADDVEEVDADELADTLEKKIDLVAVLKLEENRLITRLKRVRFNRAKILKTINS